MAYSKKIWDAVLHEWLAGQLSLSDITRTYGPSRSGILKRSVREKWPSRGSLNDEVRKEIQSALLTDTDKSVEKVTGKVTPQEVDDIIQRAALRGAEVVRFHRGLLGRLLGQAEVTLSELEKLERIRIEIIEKGKLRHREKLVTAIIKNRIDGMEAVGRVLKSAIPLDRQAFSLDSEKGEVQSIKYVAPDYRKPKGTGLSEDAWENQES